MDEFDGRVLICFWRLMYLLLSQQTITQRFYGCKFSHSVSHPNALRSSQTKSQAPIQNNRARDSTLSARATQKKTPPSPHSWPISLFEHSIFSTSSIKAKCFAVSIVRNRTSDRNNDTNKLAHQQQKKNNTPTNHTLISVVTSTKKNAAFCSTLVRFTLSLSIFRVFIAFQRRF